MPSMSREKSSFLTTFGGRLKTARKGRGISQEELAPRIGVTKDTLSRYERGEVAPTAEVIFLAVVQLGVSADWLLTGEGPMRGFTIEMAPQDPEEVRRWMDFFNRLKPEQRTLIENLMEHLLGPQ